MATICKPYLVYPAYEISQPEFTDEISRRHGDHPNTRKGTWLMSRTRVKHRHFILPMPQLFEHPGLEARARIYDEAALQLALEVIDGALANAQLTIHDIDALIVVSCTSPAGKLPGLDVDILEALNYPPIKRRTSITQMGCHGGVSAIAQAHDYLLGHPTHNVLICAVELCSLNEQPLDRELQAYVSRGLFTDAAGGFVIKGRSHTTGFCIEDFLQVLVPGTKHHMRFRVTDEGNHFHTHEKVAEGLQEGFPRVLEFLAKQGPIQFVVAHTGGPRIIIDAMNGLRVPQEWARASWKSLEDGNESSVSVIRALLYTFDYYPPEHNASGIIIAYGPGSTIEAVRVRARWHNEEVA